MKKLTIILVFLFTVTPIAGFAQVHHYGIKLGVQSAGAYSNPSIDSRVVGLVFMDLPIRKLPKTSFLQLI